MRKAYLELTGDGTSLRRFIDVRRNVYRSRRTLDRAELAEAIGVPPVVEHIENVEIQPQLAAIAEQDRAAMQRVLERPENRDLKIGPPAEFADHPTALWLIHDNSRGPKDKRRDPAVMRKQLNDFDIAMCGQRDPNLDPWIKMKNLAFLNPEGKNAQEFYDDCFKKFEAYLAGTYDPVARTWKGINRPNVPKSAPSAPSGLPDN